MSLILEVDRDKSAGTQPALHHTSSSSVTDAPAGVEGHLLACLDDGAGSRTILDQAMAVADALDLSVAAALVIETPTYAGAPADPLEWQVRRRESLDRLEHIIGLPSPPVERVVLTGSAADELTGWARDHRASVLALGTHATAGHRTGLGETAQRILQCASASLLLVPAGRAFRLPYRRLLVPLDGSVRAESVLPFAVRIARAHGAELVLAHVVPQPESIDAPESDGAAHALCVRLAEQNEKGARDYLNGLQTQIWKEGLSVRAVVIGNADARVELVRLAQAQHADLVVLASHGRTGMVDVPCGSVTEYLATHAPAPLLIVRPSFDHRFGVPADSRDQGFFGFIPVQG